MIAIRLYPFLAWHDPRKTTASECPEHASEVIWHPLQNEGTKNITTADSNIPYSVRVECAWLVTGSLQKGRAVCLALKNKKAEKE